MDEFMITELQEQNKQLRSLVASLNATLLRKAVAEFEMRRALGSAGSADAERLLHEAEDCFRCARISRLREEIAEGLEVAGRELMALAVEIETQLQHAKRKL